VSRENDKTVIPGSRSFNVISLMWNVPVSNLSSVAQAARGPRLAIGM
jgi:hypothetical protein